MPRPEYMLLRYKSTVTRLVKHLLPISIYSRYDKRAVKIFSVVNLRLK